MLDTDDEKIELDHRDCTQNTSYMIAEKSKTRVAATLVLFKKLRARLHVEGDKAI